jgi:uncharacterized protein DUF4235
MVTAQEYAAGFAAYGSRQRGSLMSAKHEGRSFRALKEAVGLVAVVASRVLQIGWKHATGSQPPAGPDDRQVSLGKSVIWTLLLGAVATTARMIAIRYASHLLPSSQRQSMEGSADGGQTGGPSDLPISI